MKVELMVSYRIVRDMGDAPSRETAMWHAESDVKAKMPPDAYDVRVEALHCPPATLMEDR